MSELVSQSEFEVHTFFVAEFSQELHHEVSKHRRTANENHSLAGWLRHALFKHVLGHKADPACPLLTRQRFVVHSETEFKAGGVVLGQLVQFVLQQDILNGAVAKEHRVRSAVISVQRSTKHAVERRDSSATPQIANLGALIHPLASVNVKVTEPSVVQSPQRTLHLDFVA